MELDVFEKLEKRIGQVMDKLDRLREEKKQVAFSRSQTSGEIEQIRKICARLEEENQRLKAKLSKIDQINSQKELKIKKRLERLVEKLGLVDNLA